MYAGSATPSNTSSQCIVRQWQIGWGERARGKARERGRGADNWHDNKHC